MKLNSIEFEIDSYMKKEKHQNQLILSFQRFLNKSPFSFIIVLAAGYIVICLTGYYFSLGYQIYPLYPDLSTYGNDTECNMINYHKTMILERQVRIYFSSNSDLPLAQQNCFRLFRLNISGPMGYEEMRFFDNYGIYSVFYQEKQINITAIHFNLNQEGQNHIDIMCLDTILNSTDVDITPFDRDQGYTLFKKDPHFIENLCYIDKQMNYFTRSNFRSKFPGPYKSNHDTIASVQNEKVQFLSQGWKMDETVFQDITPTSFIMKIIVPLYYHSHILEQSPFYSTNDSFINFFVSVTSKTAPINYFSGSDVCWKSLELQNTEESFANLTEDQLNEAQSLILPPEHVRGSQTIVYLPHIKNRNKVYNKYNFDQDISQYVFSNLFRMFSQAYLYIGEDDDLLGSTFFMPKDSPIVIIIPPWKELEGNHSEMVNLLIQAGRKVHFIKGIIEKEGLNEEEQKCINAPDNQECQNVLKNIQYEIDLNAIEKLFN